MTFVREQKVARQKLNGLAAGERGAVQVRRSISRTGEIPMCLSHTPMMTLEEEV
jgi:hypothetical protein